MCFLLASVPLSGAVFSSNALMQPLEEISSIPSEGYALVRDGSSDYLYLDGAVVKTVTREGGQEVTREGGSESIRTFSDGRLVSEQRPDGTVLQYDYSENGTLRRIEYIADGETVRVVQYNWSPVSGLDVSVLQDHILAPVLGIRNPKTDPRIRFVGEIKGAEALERTADSSGGIAFSMYPTSMEELLRIADSGRLMPPKSTWFEPKLRSGLFIHRF